MGEFTAQVLLRSISSPGDGIVRITLLTQCEVESGWLRLGPGSVPRQTFIFPFFPSSPVSAE